MNNNIVLISVTKGTLLFITAFLFAVLVSPK